MKIRLELSGVTPLLMHNPRMVDPDFDIVVKIRELTAKRKKTEADRKEIERLEWYGGIYTDEDEKGNVIVVQPSSKVRKCLIETARMYKLGKHVERSLSFLDLNIPLSYDGSRDIDELWASKKYASRLSVGIGQSRTMRVRPQFLPWGLGLYGLLLEDAMDPEEFARIAGVAGQAVGIGDNRVNGYGRFTAEVSALDEESGQWKPLRRHSGVAAAAS